MQDKRAQKAIPWFVPSLYAKAQPIAADESPWISFVNGLITVATRIISTFRNVARMIRAVKSMLGGAA